MTASVVLRRIGFDAALQTFTVSPGSRVRLDVSLCPSVVQLASVATTSAAPATSIANNQEAGVDEGDIVKQLGDHLLILRRGRLYSIKMRENSLRVADVRDAFGAGINPENTWYDELLVWRDRVVVIGYSYERGGTELGVFLMRPSGRLRHLDTYQLRSNDYYSARNYASRLVGQRLVFYAPLSLHSSEPPALRQLLPALRRWHVRGHSGVFERTATAPRVFSTTGRDAPLSVTALHSVTTCDLDTLPLKCESTVVAGSHQEAFYASPRAVYLWTAGYHDRRPGLTRAELQTVPAQLIRIPYDGSAPTTIGVHGSPIDQFSFMERQDSLFTIVRTDASYDTPDALGTTSLSLLRLPLRALGGGNDTVPSTMYQRLAPPAPSRRAVAGNEIVFSDELQARFVGDFLLYGVGNGWGRPQAQPQWMHVVALGTGHTTSIRVSHSIDRIEPVGDRALIAGSDSSGLHLTLLRLDSAPMRLHTSRIPAASQGEMRSHGFFYRPDASMRNTGVFGIPLREPAKPGYEHLFSESVSMQYVRTTRDSLALSSVVRGLPASAKDDECRASCVDWYGNSRPIFVNSGVLTLLGHELIQSKEMRDGLREVSRVRLTPDARSR